MSKIQKKCEVCKEFFIPKWCCISTKKSTEEKRRTTKGIGWSNSWQSSINFFTTENYTSWCGKEHTVQTCTSRSDSRNQSWNSRLVRIERKAVERMVTIQEWTPTTGKKSTIKLYRLEPEDCCTIGEIAQKFGISDSSVYKDIRKDSIPIRQIGKYVYAPKTEIDNIYDPK